MEAAPMQQLPDDILATFGALFDQARASPGEMEANAMTLATATSDGRPSARTVLLKSCDARGFVFYTHLDSHKGRELHANPQAALLFLWRSLGEAGVQVRIEGRVEQVDDAEADAYFASRPRASQVGAWASLQSRTLESRAQFDQGIAAVEAEYQGREVPRPPQWSGLRVVPDAVEFWHGVAFRLHQRVRHERSAQGDWGKRMLYP